MLWGAFSFRLPCCTKFRAWYPTFGGTMGLYSFDLAMLAKQWWRLWRYPKKLLSRVLRARYFPTGDILWASLGSRPSFTWRGLMAAHYLFCSGYHWRVGSGTQIQLVMIGEWRECNNYFGRVIVPLSLPLHSAGLGNRTSLFRITLKMAPSRFVAFTTWPYRLRIIQALVLVLKGRLRGDVKSGVNLKKRIPNLQVVCPFCQAEFEDDLHTLVRCSFARQVWGLVSLGVDLGCWPSLGVLPWMLAVSSQLDTQGLGLFLCGCWSIWWFRNRRAMEGESVTPMQVSSFATQYLDSFTHQDAASSACRDPVARNSKGHCLAWLAHRVPRSGVGEVVEAWAAREAIQLALRHGWRRWVRRSGNAVAHFLAQIASGIEEGGYVAPCSVLGLMSLDIECPNTQPGSSNTNVEPQMEYVHYLNTKPGSSNPDVEPQMQTNIQKGKGVAVDDGNYHDLDEVEWDEVCKIVDSYPEGNGSGDDDDDRVSDESDGLFDFELEGDNGEGYDSETGSNVDDCGGGGADSGQEEVESSDSEDTTLDDDVCLSQDDFDSVVSSDGEEKESHPVFNPRNKYDPHFEIGMIFSKIELREAIHSHVVSTKWSLKIFKNDKRRVYVKRLGDGCQCKWLSTKYEDAFRTDPKRNVKGFRKDVIKELRCHVSRNQAYRAKKKALEAIEGKAEDQFDSLWDYASELRNSNHGSTMMMTCDRGGWVSSKGSLWRGLAFKKGLWNAAKATTVSEFNYKMEELAKLDPKVVDWLSNKPPAHWSRKKLDLSHPFHPTLEGVQEDLQELEDWSMMSHKTRGKNDKRPEELDHQIEEATIQGDVSLLWRDRQGKRLLQQSSQLLLLKRPHKNLQGNPQENPCSRVKGNPQENPCSKKILIQGELQDLSSLSHPLNQILYLLSQIPVEWQVNKCSTSLHNVQQNQSSANGVPCLTKGGKKFVTMTNLSATVAAIKKKKKIDKEAK
ncbi:hypothetical protein Sango_1908200 [Sesamum angolense]|uniref:Transposase MuDR plant domain-containing protein n=1 Tax=Sesamum angolense TaxID=2727404 RepID=A0AAE1WJB7_9LAMI|nr:hypothetical protein Sango_1908200 [Sesamum angolense]